MRFWYHLGSSSKLPDEHPREFYVEVPPRDFESISVFKNSLGQRARRFEKSIFHCYYRVSPITVRRIWWCILAIDCHYIVADLRNTRRLTKTRVLLPHESLVFIFTALRIANCSLFTVVQSVRKETGSFVKVKKLFLKVLLKTTDELDSNCICCACTVLWDSHDWMSFYLPLHCRKHPLYVLLVMLSLTVQSLIASFEVINSIFAWCID